MTTRAEVHEAERLSRKQRIANARWLRIERSAASAEDVGLAEKLLAAAAGDGAEFDRLLAHPGVNDLFNRSVIRVTGDAAQRPAALPEVASR